MLVTTCKQCGARFRVTPDQLNLRQGLVRCGECHDVFNGFEALERFPGDDTGARLLAARSARGSPGHILETLEEIDFGKRLDPSRPPPLPELDAQEFPAVASATTVDLQVDEPLSAPVAHLSGAVTSEPPPLRTGVPQSGTAPPIHFGAPEAYEAAPPTRLPRAWSLGAMLLAIVLAVQLAYAYRSRIAQQYPVLRPVLESACASAGCTVPYVNEESALKLEDSELLEVPGRPGQIALSARIRNLSASAQDFPHLELTLTDLTGQTAVRRVLRPIDYLGRAPITGEVLAAGSEVLVSIRLDTGRVKATGYELLLFYP
jgi:predicted Zn finger-like uncharacterized protein